MRIKNNIVLYSKQMQLFVLIVCFLLCSCDERKKRDETTKVVFEWIGKEIRFPKDVQCYVSGKATLPEFCDECFKKEFKMLLYVDSIGCSDCRLNLFQWKHIMEEVDSLFQGMVGFLLFFQPKNVRDMTNLFFTKRFDYPVFIDINNQINYLNRFPKEIEFQCFLLDQENKVIAIGNPTMNHQIWELFQSYIKKENKSPLKMK